jgi:Zn-dependent M28 family amino/carboxypeptidase
MKKQSVLIFCIGLIGIINVVAQNPADYASSITLQELKEHLYVYASDEFAGRDTGTEGEQKAIHFLKDYYQSIGVQGGNNNKTYFQNMVLSTRRGKTLNGTNVLAYIPGSDKKDEVLVITSHLDHIGVDPDGQVNNGADDDGSGTVAMMEIAEAFQLAVEQGEGPRRSILFLHVSGEERGLLGSKYYTDNPVYPLKETVANLNMDMIGRVDSLHLQQPDYLYLIGSDILSDDLHEISITINEKYVNLNLDFRYNDPTTLVWERGRYRENNYYYRSDHYHFIKNNIPAIFYFNGTHPDYHTPNDTPDKIEYELLKRRTKLIFHTAWVIANREERIELNDKKGD